MPTTKTRTEATCSSCGRTGRAVTNPYVCQKCKRYADTEPVEPFRGKRIRDGLIWRFVPEDPPDDTEDLIDILARNLADEYTITRRYALCECGCLLPKPHSSCPNCLVWATKDAVLHSWRVSEIAWNEAS